LRGIYGRFNSKIRFENESDGRFDSRFDSNEKIRFAGPYTVHVLRIPDSLYADETVLCAQND